MGVLEIVQSLLGVDAETAQLALVVIGIGGLLMLNEKFRHDALHKHSITTQQRAAQHPSIDKRWKQKIPQGLVLGKVGHDWFCLPEKATASGFSVGHCLVMGGSGTGKTSSVYAESIMADWINKEEHPDLFYTFMAVDIKGEIHKTFCPPIAPPDSEEGKDNPYYLLDPVDRDHSYGYNPFCLIDAADYVSRDLIIQVSSDIASAFVSVSEKDRYFSANALTILTGLLAYCIESNPRIEMVDMMQRIISEDVKALLEEVMGKALAGSVTMHFLGRFQGKGDGNESFDDILSTLTTQLNAFALDAVAYMLRDNPHKIGVEAIREKPIILSVPDNLLDENTFAPVYRMVLTSMQRYLISRIPDPGTKPVVLFYDELFSLGGSEKGSGIPDLQHFLSIARQYGAVIVAAVQSEKMLVKQYGREGSKILEDNMCKVILQITDADSVRSAKDWTGKFDDRTVSVNANAKLSTTVSWHQRDVFDGAEFSSLVSRKQVIVVPLDDHFMSIGKSQWFRESYFKRIQERITKCKQSTIKEKTT